MAQYIKCQKVAFYFSNIITKPINTFKNEKEFTTINAGGNCYSAMLLPG